MTNNILIFAELNENGISKVSKEIISYCSVNFKNSIITVITLISESHKDKTVDNLKQTGDIDKIILLINEQFNVYSTEIYANAITDKIKELNPDILLIGATCTGRDLAPRIASRLNIGLTADCTQIDLDENSNLLATRPTYGGKLMATILSKTKPQFATIRPGALKAQINGTVKNPEIIESFTSINTDTLLTEVISYKCKQQDTDWTAADVIIAGGKGLGSKENFDLIFKLCEKTGAKPAASRCAVEQGWADKSIQVGQTGCSVSPKLYIAFGISGAMQHTVGIENAERIIAVNTDPNAPIMMCSDVAINTDAVSLLKELISD